MEILSISIVNVLTAIAPAFIVMLVLSWLISLFRRG